MRMLPIFLIGILIGIPALIQAQSATLEIPRQSSFSKVVQRVGLTDIAVKYHRPAVKNREIWGNIVPYTGGAMPWRAGANENTIIYFSTDVEIEGKKLPAGKYGLHMIPTEDQWTIIFSKNHTSWGSFAYNQAEDALRVQVKPKTLQDHHEFLTYGFENIQADQATCVLNWEKKQIPFTISVDVHEIVIADITKQLGTEAGFTWLGWRDAANYCLQNNTHHDQGLTWINRSIFTNPNFNNILVKAKLTTQKAGKDPNEAKDMVLSEIEKDLNNQLVTWKDWNQAAKYCLTNDINIDKGLAWAEKSMNMNKNFDNTMVKSQLLAQKGETKTSSKLMEEAIALSSNQQLNQFAYNLLFAGKAKQAIPLFEANVKRFPKDPNVHDSLGEAYMRSGQNDKAIASFKKSLSLDPPANVKANSIALLKKMGVDYDQN